MTSGMFYKAVRLVVSAVTLAAGAPALAMTVGLGQYVAVRGESAVFKIVGAKLTDQTFVTLDLQNIGSGEVVELKVENKQNLTDVPELTTPVLSGGSGSRSLPLLY